MKELEPLLNKRFSVYVEWEFEGYTDFLGVMKRLNNFTEFFDFESKAEQKRQIKEWLRTGSIYVDNKMEIRFTKSELNETEKKE